MRQKISVATNGSFTRIIVETRNGATVRSDSLDLTPQSAARLGRLLMSRPDPTEPSDDVLPHIPTRRVPWRV